MILISCLQHITKEIKRIYGLEFTADAELLRDARLLKETINTCGQETATVSLSQQGMILTLSLSEFNAIVAEFINDTIKILLQVIQDACLMPCNIHGIILVGGSSQLPIVSEKINKVLGNKIIQNVDPNLAVVYGAAIHAYNINNPSANNSVLLDVLPISLGIETADGIMEKILLRNSPIPAVCTQNFTTSHDNQSSVRITVYQGESNFVENNIKLSEILLTNIPPMRAHEPIISVKFATNVNGILTVSAMEKKSNTECSAVINPTYGLTVEQIHSMIRKFDKKEEEKKKYLLSQIALAHSMVESMHHIMHSKNIVETDRQRIHSCIAALHTAIESQNINTITKSIADVSNIIEDNSSISI